MRLEPGGIDIFYIDESGDRDVFTMTAVSIPFLRQMDGLWEIVWPDHFAFIRDWRRWLRSKHRVPVQKELHGVKFASGRGRYREGKQQFSRKGAAAIYRDMLASLTFLQKLSIISVVGTRDSELYGQTKLEANLHALLQRMRKACEASGRNGLVFFDQGHGEYRKLYRRSLWYLPTGSKYGGWGASPTTNLPLDMFTKDANIKEAAHSSYIQLADIIAYALFAKVKGEVGSLAAWQSAVGLGGLYDSIPVTQLNTYASTRDPQGIVRL